MNKLHLNWTSQTKLERRAKAKLRCWIRYVTLVALAGTTTRCLFISKVITQFKIRNRFTHRCQLTGHQDINTNNGLWTTFPIVNNLCWAIRPVQIYYPFICAHSKVTDIFYWCNLYLKIACGWLNQCYTTARLPSVEKECTSIARPRS